MPLDGVVRSKDYRRLLTDHAKGREYGTYPFKQQVDGDQWVDAEWTFPLQEIDTITAVPIIPEV